MGTNATFSREPEDLVNFAVIANAEDEPFTHILRFGTSVGYFDDLVTEIQT